LLYLFLWVVASTAGWWFVELFACLCPLSSSPPPFILFWYYIVVVFPQSNARAASASKLKENRGRCTRGTGGRGGEEGRKEEREKRKGERERGEENRHGTVTGRRGGGEGGGKRPVKG